MTIEEFNSYKWPFKTMKPKVIYKGEIYEVKFPDEEEKLLYIHRRFNGYENDYRWVRYENCEIINE